jgi:hypothetical protein
MRDAPTGVAPNRAPPWIVFAKDSLVPTKWGTPEVSAKRRSATLSQNCLLDSAVLAGYHTNRVYRQDLGR